MAIGVDGTCKTNKVFTACGCGSKGHNAQALHEDQGTYLDQALHTEERNRTVQSADTLLKT